MDENMEKNKFGNIYIGFNARLLLNVSVFIICFILLYIFLLKIFSVRQENIFNYTDKSSLDYKVYLKNNNFYEVDHLDKDMVYIASLIDKVKVNFNYDFNSDVALDLDFKYSIIGNLTIQDANGKKNYYEKNYTLLDEKSVSLNNDNNKNINEEIDINYDYYNKIANEFKTNYGVDTLSKLTLYLRINKNILDDQMLLSDSDVMSIEIPLSERSINIKMDSNEIDDIGNIINKSNIFVDNLLYVILSILFIILLIIFTIRIVRLLNLLKNNRSKYDKYVNRILTEYDRMIAETTTAPITKKLEIIKIKKFEELVDIRDNLRLPIMYYSVTKHHKCWFYIIFSKKMYLHVVKAVDLEDSRNGKDI